MKRIAVVALCLTLLLTSCAKKELIPAPAPLPEVGVEVEIPEENPDSVATWSEFDLDTGWDENAVTVQISEQKTVASGAGVAQIGDTVKISAPGTYIFSGALKGQILIRVDKTEAVHLVFNGFALSCSDRSPLYCEKADRVSLTLVPNTENSVTDNDSGYIEGMKTDFGRYAGAIHAKCPFTINGSGSLSVETSYRHGIVSDNLRIVSGTLTVHSQEDGLKAKNALSVRSGNVTVVSKGDGMKVTEDAKDNKGNLVIENGTVNVTSDEDGLDVSVFVQILGGTVCISSKDHAVKSGGKFFFGGNATLDIEVDEDAAKTDAKGINAKEDAVVAGGSVMIRRSFEGIQSKNASVRIDGGKLEIHAFDDGINAQTKVEITGGTLFIEAKGDGIDSNGDILISGGSVIVRGPTANNESPLDCGDKNSSIRVTGGFLLAYGSAGMAKFPSASGTTLGTLGYIGALKKGVVYSLRDEEGTAVATFTLLQSAQSLCISCDGIQTGKTYTLYEDAKTDASQTNGKYDPPASEGGTAVFSFEAKQIVTLHTGD